MKRFKDKEGITLIALIITIIVMLILVAVTISVAIQGGLFNRAKDASEKTQKEADKEQLLSAVAAAVDDNGEFHLDQVETPAGFNYSNGVYTNRKTGNKYIIDSKTGKVEEKTNIPTSYSFKLGDLPTDGMTIDGDSIAYFDLEKVKNKLGTDLFEDNSKYISIDEENGIKYGNFILETNNNEIVDGGALHFGIASRTDDTKYIIQVAADFTDSKFMVAIYTKDYDEVIGRENFGKIAWSEFVALYPDTTFTFIDLSVLQ